MYIVGLIATNEKKLMKLSSAIIEAFTTFCQTSKKKSLDEVHLVNKDDLVNNAIVKAFQNAAEMKDGHANSFSRTDSEQTGQFRQPVSNYVSKDLKRIIDRPPAPLPDNINRRSFKDALVGGSSGKSDLEEDYYDTVKDYPPRQNSSVLVRHQHELVQQPKKIPEHTEVKEQVKETTEPKPKGNLNIFMDE